MVGWLGWVGDRRFFGQGLVRSGGHIEQQLAQVGAALNSAQVLLDSPPPAGPHGASHHQVHGRLRLRALPVGHVVHGNRNVLHRQRVVHRHPDGHTVDGLARLPLAFARNRENLLLGIAQLTFDVPQTIATLVTAVHGGAGVQVRSRGGCG